ncbi:MAG: ATP-binding cassette domain-containing protein [Spirochaetes bacterium]|nr:ATP-binding cassette domain-containing protein [Spirochaetota bacterium]
MKPQLLLRLRGLAHSYGENAALRGVDLDLYAGEIHALIGDHKSGKSTLAHVAGGVEPVQTGSYELRGATLERLTPRHARRVGVALVQEQLQVMPALTAWQNMAVGNLSRLIIRRADEQRLRAHCRDLLQRLDLDIDFQSPLHTLSEEQQQAIELVRVMARDPEVLILDEISSRFKPHRLKRLFALLSDFKAEGKAILFVTPDIEEIFQFADRVTVLRDGERIGTERVSDLDRIRLVRMAYEFTSYLQDGDDDRGPVYLRRQNDQLIKNLPIAAVVLDAETRVFSVNAEAEKLLQYPDLQPGKTELGGMLQHLGVGASEEIQEAVRRREARTWESVPIAGDRKVRLACHPIKNYEGTALGTILFIEDVLMDDLVKEYLARAEQMTSIAELAAGVAHEINNPLGIIQNYLELLKMSEGADEQTGYLERIEGEVNLITEVVSSLLSFSRVKQLPIRHVDVGRLLEEVVLLVGHRLRDKQITVSRYVPRHPVYVDGLENKLKQLFVNLTANAIEAMLHGGVLKLSVEEDHDTGQVEISISDTGHGIPADLQDDIFKPFFSTKVTKTNTGLGLAVCQHIVDLHDGVITFRSKPGETTFNVVLPMKPAPASDTDGASDRAPDETLARSGADPHIPPAPPPERSAHR